MSGLAQFFKDGGFFMYVNLLWSIASIAVIVDRVYALFIRNSLNANEFMNHIQKTVRAGNIDEGWTRWVLEQYGFPFVSIRPEDFKSPLGEKIDVLILGDDVRIPLMGAPGGGRGATRPVAGGRGGRRDRCAETAPSRRQR